MSHNSKSSSVATAGFKWIDILEKEFDRSFLELDEVRVSDVGSSAVTLNVNMLAALDKKLGLL